MPSRTVRAVAMTENSHRKKKMKFDASSNGLVRGCPRKGWVSFDRKRRSNNHRSSFFEPRQRDLDRRRNVDFARHSRPRRNGRQNRVEASRDEDISYARKTLLTGTTPGSYLVPTIQADQIIQLLTSANAFRQAGARIWPMANIQKLNVPIATAAPTIVWGDSSGTGPGGQGVTLTPSDLNAGQVSFDLKSQKSLTAIPNELWLSVSQPLTKSFRRFWPRLRARRNGEDGPDCCRYWTADASLRSRRNYDAER